MYFKSVRESKKAKEREEDYASMSVQNEEEKMKKGGRQTDCVSTTVGRQTQSKPGGT